ncbi:MAG: FAD:protein FMN transferase [Planctomycetaceae bacterium]|nr:FAD:protein FMN transferase [Planctomycetaceae bacterium]
MGKLIVVGVVWAGVAAAMAGEPSLERFEFLQTEMAVPIRIVLFAPDNATASNAAKAAFQRFHELNTVLSDYDPQSELRRLCASSGEGCEVPVSDPLWRVLVRAEQLSKLSDGAFDVTIGPVVHLWRSARQTKELPSPKSLEAALQRIGYPSMRLIPSRQAVELLKPNMRLDLGGIAKGYAVDEAMGTLRRHGLSRMLVDAGGNLALGDPPPGRSGWRIGIAPSDVRDKPSQFLQLSNIAMSTSGDLWQHTMIRGVRYSHLIDPRTGMALTDQCSVTVLGPDGLSTDGLSSAVAILGPEKGLKLIDDTPGTAALFTQMVDGRRRVYCSKRWKPGETPETQEERPAIR